MPSLFTMKNSETSNKVITIRPFEMKDLDDCIKCGFRFHQESIFRDIPMDVEKLRKLGEKAFERLDHLFMVYEKDGEIVGMFMASIQQYYFGHDYLACDILWYIDKNDRGSARVAAMTLEYYKKWAATWNVRETMIGTSTGIDIERTAKLLEHLGFKQVGTNHKYRAGE